MAILSIGATATHATGTLCTMALYAQAMVVAGATAAMSAVSIDELGDKAFAAWYGALVQHSAPLHRTHACFYLASCMRVHMCSIAVQVASFRLLPGCPDSEFGP